MATTIELFEMYCFRGLEEVLVRKVEVEYTGKGISIGMSAHENYGVNVSSQNYRSYRFYAC